MENGYPQFKRYKKMDGGDYPKDSPYYSLIVCFVEEAKGAIVHARPKYTVNNLGEIIKILPHATAPKRWEDIPIGTMKIAFPKAYTLGLKVIARGGDE